MTLKNLINQRIKENKEQIWTPADFFDLGNYEAVKKNLQRLVSTGELRRIDRGLYDKPAINSLTGQANPPDYHKVIEAVSRRDQMRMLIDGMTCANELGLTNAIPGQVLIHTDGRLRQIKLNNLVIKFKLTAPSKLYWANRPAMRIVQALYWLEDIINNNKEVSLTIKAKLFKIISNSSQKNIISSDLRAGLHTLPVWMQTWVQEFLFLLENSKQEKDE